MAQAQLDKAAAQGQEEAEDEAVAEPATVARLAALLQRMGQGGVMPPEVRTYIRHAWPCEQGGNGGAAALGWLVGWLVSHSG